MVFQRKSGICAESIKENSDLDGPLIGWEADGHHVQLVGTEQLDGAPTHKLRVEANGNTSFYFLDAESYLIVQVESSAAGISATSRMKDYREVGGLQFPFSVTIESAQGPMELIFDSIEVDVDVDETRFTMGG